jgi:hypothetical protein
MDAVASDNQDPARLLGQVHHLHQAVANLTTSADMVIHNLADDINQWFYRPAPSATTARIAAPKVA